MMTMIAVPLGIEFAAPEEEDQVVSVEKLKIESFSDHYYNLEDVENRMADTFEEVQRVSECITTTAHNGVAPPGTDPRLTYRYSLPLSVQFHHSSFGAEIILQPGILSGRMMSVLPPSSSCCAATMAGNRSCYNEIKSRPTKPGPSHDSSPMKSSSSWKSSAILRTVYQGATVKSVS